MILVDTSVLVDHLRRGNARLVGLLEATEVCSHAFVIGELACGRLQNRREILALLRSLPQLRLATDDEVLYFIEQQALTGRGIGYVDAHLLTAGKLAGITELWTLDKRLDAVKSVLAR
jgi:predicted nucleic acid-binding protein